MSDQAAGPDATPQLTVVKGEPTEEELAAVLVVLASRRTSASVVAVGRAPAPASSRSGWAAHGRSLRTPLQPGPGVWRMSGRS